MKNVLIYTHADKKFTGENVDLVKIHIDNSFELGWKKEDILLYTNFKYSYNGIESTVVPDDLDWSKDRTSNKIFVVDYLLKNRLLDKDLYWYHDFDAYQNEVITEEELGLETCDLGVTGYGYKPQVNGGSFFFRETAGDIFDLWCTETKKINRTRADEKTMTDLLRAKRIDWYKWLNITYNFGQRCPDLCYKQATKPLKVLHFHPVYKYYEAKYWNLDIFMYGKNRQNKPMMSDRLIKLFNKHKIK